MRTRSASVAAAIIVTLGIGAWSVMRSNTTAQRDAPRTPAAVAPVAPRDAAIAAPPQERPEPDRQDLHARFEAMSHEARGAAWYRANMWHGLSCSSQYKGYHDLALADQWPVSLPPHVDEADWRPLAEAYTACMQCRRDTCARTRVLAEQLAAELGVAGTYPLHAPDAFEIPDMHTRSAAIEAVIALAETDLGASVLEAETTKIRNGVAPYNRPYWTPPSQWYSLTNRVRDCIAGRPDACRKARESVAHFRALVERLYPDPDPEKVHFTPHRDVAGTSTALRYCPTRDTCRTLMVVDAMQIRESSLSPSGRYALVAIARKDYGIDLHCIDVTNGHEATMAEESFRYGGQIGWTATDTILLTWGAGSSVAEGALFAPDGRRLPGISGSGFDIGEHRDLLLNYAHVGSPRADSQHFDIIDLRNGRRLPEPALPATWFKVQSVEWQRDRLRIVTIDEAGRRLPAVDHILPSDLWRERATPDSP